MHAALPDSISAGHSMNDSPRGTVTGQKVYAISGNKPTKTSMFWLATHTS
jgi:hypothetical protein